MLLAWFEKSTTSDFTVQDLINKMKTWFTEGYLYDDVWETLKNRVEHDLLPSRADVKNMITRRRKKLVSSKLGYFITCTVLAVLFAIVAITVGYCEFHLIRFLLLE